MKVFRNFLVHYLCEAAALECGMIDKDLKMGRIRGLQV